MKININKDKKEIIQSYKIKIQVDIEKEEYVCIFGVKCALFYAGYMNKDNNIIEINYPYLYLDTTIKKSFYKGLDKYELSNVVEKINLIAFSNNKFFYIKLLNIQPIETKNIFIFGDSHSYYHGHPEKYFSYAQLMPFVINENYTFYNLAKTGANVWRTFNYFNEYKYDMFNKIYENENNFFICMFGAITEKYIMTNIFTKEQILDKLFTNFNIIKNLIYCKQYPTPQGSEKNRRIDTRCYKDDMVYIINNFNLEHLNNEIIDIDEILDKLSFGHYAIKNGKIDTHTNLFGAWVVLEGLENKVKSKIDMFNDKVITYDDILNIHKCIFFYEYNKKYYKDNTIENLYGEL